jgi:hypothetical protein
VQYRICFEQTRIETRPLRILLQQLVRDLQPDDVFPKSGNEFLPGTVRELLNNEFLEFDELKPGRLQIDNNILLSARTLSRTC